MFPQKEEKVLSGSGGDILLNLRILIKSQQSLSLPSQILRNAKILIFVYIEEAKLNLIIFYFSYMYFLQAFSSNCKQDALEVLNPNVCLSQ